MSAAGAKGLDFAGNLGLANINFATVHAYPQAFGIPFSNLGDYDDYTWINTYFIASRAALAKAANKPIILEEFGTVPQGQQSTPGSSSYTNNYGAGIVQSPRFVPSSQDVGPMPSIAASKQVCINMYTTSLSGLAPIVLLTLQAAVATAVSLPAYDRIHSFKPLSLMFAMRTAMHALMHMTHSADAQNDYCLIAASILHHLGFKDAALQTKASQSGISTQESGIRIYAGRSCCQWICWSVPLVGFASSLWLSIFKIYHGLCL